MSSLPFLSHRLFVSAIRQDDGIAKPAPTTESGSLRRPGIASAIPLELLTATESTGSERIVSRPHASTGEPGLI